MHRHGAFRIHLVLHVSDIKMRVPMDEHFDIALHGFEGMRVKRVGIVLQYLLFSASAVQSVCLYYIQ